MSRAKPTPKYARSGVPKEPLPRSYQIQSPEHETGGTNAISVGSNYTDDEAELLRRIDAYRRESGLKFVPYTAVFHIIREMGYVKQSGSNSSQI